MKKAMLIVLCGMVALTFSANAFGTEKATPQEVMEKVSQAVKLIQEKGEAAYPIIRDKNGPFYWKDTYVFVGDLDGRLLVHPNHKLEGRNMLGAKDTSGKLFHAEMINGVKKSPEGFWIDYYWVKPGQKTPSPKCSYHVVAPDTTIFAGAGVWDVTLDKVKLSVQ